MTKTKLRKAEASLDHMAIVKDYAEGLLTVPEIAEKHRTSENNVGLIATRFWKSLTNMKEARALMSLSPDSTVQANVDAKNSLKELQGTELINKEFLKLLSGDTEALLSDQEAVYCWVYVHTGDTIEAMKTSGLDVGLYSEKKRERRFSYDRAVALRSHYLNCKPNVTAYIKELRETRLIDADVGRARIQSELIEQLEQMKTSGDRSNRTAILRTIELLGKTVGAFVDRVEIQEINPANALDKLIEMAQEAQVHEVEPEKVREITE